MDVERFGGRLFAVAVGQLTSVARVMAVATVAGLSDLPRSLEQQTHHRPSGIDHPQIFADEAQIPSPHRAAAATTSWTGPVARHTLRHLDQPPLIGDAVRPSRRRRGARARSARRPGVGLRRPRAPAGPVQARPARPERRPELAQHVILHFRSPPARSGLSPGSRANCLTLGYRFDTQTIRAESYAAVVSNAPTPPRRRDTTPSAPPIS
jgi:hypothetical protein